MCIAVERETGTRNPDITAFLYFRIHQSDELRRRYKSLPVKDLKEKLRERYCRVGGRKVYLIERLAESDKAESPRHKGAIWFINHEGLVCAGLSTEDAWNGPLDASKSYRLPLHWWFAGWRFIINICSLSRLRALELLRKTIRRRHWWDDSSIEMRFLNCSQNIQKS